MSNPSSICVECLKEPNVWRKEIVQTDATCILCGRETQASIDLNERSARQLFRGLVRYHFDAEEYENGPFLSVENPLVVPPNQDPNEDHDGLLDLQDKLWFGDQDDDPIYVGRESQWYSVKTEPNLKLVSIRRRLENENYFSVEPALLDKLDAVREHISSTAKELTVFRARVGFRELELLMPKLQPDRIPFSGDQIGAPPPLYVNESGRVNRAGVSFFYVASDFNTAIAEVRPHPGDFVSVGKFKQTHECCIADFSRLDVSEFCRSNETYETFRFLHAINKELSTPVTPHERATGYLLGQLIGDVVRSMGFSGIRFSSSVGKGVNYCFFEQSQFRFVEGSQRFEHVLRLDYEHETMPSLQRTSNDDENSEIPF